MYNCVRNEDLSVTLTLTQKEFKEHFCFCSDCGEVMFVDDAIRIHEKYFCECCVTTCDCCGEVIPLENVYHVEDSDYAYCRDCYLSRTCVCNDCGRHFRYEDSLSEVGDNWYCDECYPNHEPTIREYHSQKNYGDIKFYGDEDRSDALFIGFELEVDSDQRFDREAVARELQSQFDDFFAYENDGSLNYGFEIISQPASLAYHLGMMPKYREAFRYLVDNGVRSHDVESCGFHHHLDRRYFGKREDCAIAKLLYLFEKFHKELLVFSRRTEEQCSRWCRSRKQHYRGEAGWIKESLKESRYGCDYQSRYFALNLTNTDTIELRLWHGTLNPETFEATLRFTARLAELCKNTKAVELSKMTFEDLLGSDEVILSYWNRISKQGGE